MTQRSEGVLVTSTIQRDFEPLLTQFLSHLSQIIEISVKKAINEIKDDVSRAPKPSTAAEAPYSLMTRKEALAHLKISGPTLHRYQLSGKIPYHKIGRKVYFQMSELVESTKVIHRTGSKNGKEAAHD